MKHKQKQIVRLAAILGAVILAVVIVGFFMARSVIWRSNIETNVDGCWLYIHTGSGFDDVVHLLRDHGLKSEKTFRWVADRMNYGHRVKAGRYRLSNGMSNLELVRMLRSGRQVPVRVTFNNIRTGAQLAGRVAPQLECDSAGIERLFTDSVFLARFGVNRQTALSIFIPNTYEMKWNSSAEEFWERMYREYRRFWNDERVRKAKEIGLTPLQVSTLASIVDEETNNLSEKPIIAGVYINRLHRNMPLQACPTIRFVLGDYTITRVLFKHTRIPSPYNSYLNTGLPPGPICVPSIAGLDAVLNYEHHEYIYFCAKADFSGTHNFARTLSQHNRFAREYHAGLDKLQRQK